MNESPAATAVNSQNGETNDYVDAMLTFYKDSDYQSDVDV